MGLIVVMTDFAVLTNWRCTQHFKLHLTDFKAGIQIHRMMLSYVFQLKRKFTATPKRITESGKKMLNTFSRSRRFKDKLSSDVGRKIKNWFSFGKNKLTRLQFIRIIFSVETKQFRPHSWIVFCFDHDRRTQPQIVTARIQQCRIKWVNHFIFFTQILDLKIRQDHFAGNWCAANLHHILPRLGKLL